MDKGLQMREQILKRLEEEFEEYSLSRDISGFYDQVLCIINDIFWTIEDEEDSIVAEFENEVREYEYFEYDHTEWMIEAPNDSLYLLFNDERIKPDKKYKIIIKEVE